MDVSVVARSWVGAGPSGRGGQRDKCCPGRKQIIPGGAAGIIRTEVIDLNCVGNIGTGAGLGRPGLCDAEIGTLALGEAGEREEDEQRCSVEGEPPRTQSTFELKQDSHVESLIISAARAVRLNVHPVPVENELRAPA